ncbi:hypothetical protein ABLG96_08800 [Nakamurella sp. A5-74]|uniref:DUF3558 domain-containing protein n=1 Tax=Nakamurella sp. A5-74 TaxID=3158264 RepID=A0AAU8DVT6_9ACTN
MAAALALVGCGGSTEPTASQPTASATAAASNYQITCKVDGADVTTTDYHEIWTKGTSDECSSGDGKSFDYEVSEPFTDDQIAAIALARTGQSGANESGGSILGYTYPSCGETKAGSRSDPAKDWATTPEATWAQHVVDLQVTMKLCPDHPWVQQWKSQIANRAVVTSG